MFLFPFRNPWLKIGAREKEGRHSERSEGSYGLLLGDTIFEALFGRVNKSGGQRPKGAGRRCEGAPARRAGAPIPSSH